MATIPHAAYIARLKKRLEPVGPVTVIFGDEPLFREECVARLSEAFFLGEEASQPVVFHGPDGPRDPAPLQLGPFLDEARTESLFGVKKLVVLRRADAFVKQHEALLVAGLAQIPPAGRIAVVLMLEGGGKPPEALCAAFDCCEAKRPVTPHLPWQRSADAGAQPAVAWAIGRARESGRTLAPDAAARLVSCVGSDCGRLAHEIEKLVCFAGDRTRLTSEDVNVLIAAAPIPEPVFPIVDAVFERDVSRAFRLVSSALRNGLAMGGWGGSAPSVVSDPPGIGAILVASFQSRLRDVAATASRLREGATPDAAVDASAPKSKPFVRKRLAADAQRFLRCDFGQLFRFLIEADAGLKGSEDLPEFVLERLVLNLTGRTSVSREFEVF